MKISQQIGRSLQPTKHQTTNPKFYLNVSQGYSFKCSVCFDQELEMLICEQCQHQFCKTCFKRLNYNGHYQYCQNQQFTYLNRQNPSFFCPSNNNQCSSILTSSQQFDKHSTNCQYISEEIKAEFKAKITYRCHKDHQLNFPLSKTYCYLCTNYHYCGKCSICQIYICSQCRLIPCTKTNCPKGHNFAQDNYGYGIICDICNIQIRSLNNREVFSDRECNFDICANCHEKFGQQCEIKYQFETKKVDTQQLLYDYHCNDSSDDQE